MNRALTYSHFDFLDYGGTFAPITFTFQEPSVSPFHQFIGEVLPGFVLQVL